MNAPVVEVFGQADLVDLLGDEPSLLAVADAIAQTQVSRRRASRVRLPRRAVLLAAAVTLLLGGGTATALAVQRLTEAPVTQGFSALDDPSLPSAPAGLFSEIGLGSGDYYDAKQVGDGMYLARRGNALCAVVLHGFGGCTEEIPGDVWFQGDEGREYDSEQAPFQVHFYGFARDDVAAIRVTTADGTTVTVPVVRNAFQTTLENAAFADIAAIEIVYTSGRTSSVDPRTYYPATPPILTVITSTGTTAMTQTH